MYFRTHHTQLTTGLLAAFATIVLAAPAAAQSATAATSEAESAPQPTSTTGTTSDAPEAVGTTGQMQQPIVPAAPAELSTRPAYWTANAGFEADSHNTGYGFIGPHYVKPFRPNVAWVAGGTANYLYYEYPSGDGMTKVGAPGVSARGGVRFGGRNYLQATAGPSFKRRQIENRDAFGNVLASRTDSSVGLGVGVDASFDPTSRSNIYGIYDVNSTDGYQWARLAYKHQVSNFSWTGNLANFVGTEVIGQGNEDINATQFGVFWETAFVPSRVSLMVRGGWKQTSYPFGGEDRRGPWFAIGFWHRIR